MNDDMEVLTPDWLECMIEFSQQDEIGAVGPKLLFPDGRIQHAGIAGGLCGNVAHAWFRSAPDEPTCHPQTQREWAQAQQLYTLLATAAR